MWNEGSRAVSTSIHGSATFSGCWAGITRLAKRRWCCWRLRGWGWRGETKSLLIRFLAYYAAIVVGLYSAVPYKTPWCAVSLLYGMALLGGVAMARLAGRWRAVVLAAVVLGLGSEAWIAAGRYATDARNPWVYAQTGNGVFTVRDRVATYARAAREREKVAIDVYTVENWWPLPWYLREFPNVRWWRQVVMAGPAAPIVLVSPAMEGDLVRKIYEGPPPGERELYMNLLGGYVEIRPGVEVRGYVAKGLWDREEQER